MHTTTIRSEVLKLLDAGLSQRKVSALMGVSRGFVQYVQHGKHCVKSVEQRFVYPSGGFARCPGCGGLVQRPCLLCGVLSYDQ